MYQLTLFLGIERYVGIFTTRDDFFLLLREWRCKNIINDSELVQLISLAPKKEN